MASNLCKVMGREGGGERVETETKSAERRRMRRRVQLIWAEWLDGITVTADMIEKMPFENQGVCLISVHDGLSLFRRFSVIHPSLISPLKIVFARLHMYLQTQTLTPRKKKKPQDYRCSNVKINTRININPVMPHKQPRYTDTLRKACTWQAQTRANAHRLQTRTNILIIPAKFDFRRTMGITHDSGGSFIIFCSFLSNSCLTFLEVERWKGPRDGGSNCESCTMAERSRKV